MTPKEYLKQAYRLDKIIQAKIREVAELRILASSVQSPQFGERVQTTKDNEVRFVKTLMKVEEFEEVIDNKIDRLVDLKKQISEVIAKVTNPDEQLVLHHRYLLGETWEKIGAELNADERTIRRWHSKGLQHIILPEEPIII